jgi:hypothetical protein
MGTTLYDLRYAFRLLARQRVFTLLAVTTVALGIGANSAIFAVVNAVLLRPLPFRDPRRLVLIEEVIKKLSPNGIEVTPSDLLEYQRGSQAFESVAGFTPTSMDLTGAGSPERLEGLRASAEIFPLLGVSPVVGRGFTPEEDRPSSGVAVISYRLWQRRFSGAPGVVGRVFDLELFGICAAIVASNRGANGCLWFGLGILLGPFGFALAFTTGQKCPKCDSRISEQAKVCAKCGYQLSQDGGPQHHHRPG